MRTKFLWFIPLFFTFAVATLWERTAGDGRWDKINFGVIAVVVLLVVQFGLSTLEQGEGLDKLRQTAQLAAAHCADEEIVNDQRMPLVMNRRNIILICF